MNNFKDFATIVPKLDSQRSVFQLPIQSSTTFNLGEIIPLCEPIEVSPGDTWDANSSAVLRTTSLTRPIFGNLVFDYFYFFVPSRLVWPHWKEMFGENNTSHWTQPNTYTVPQLISGSEGFKVGSIADHFGLPVNVPGISVSHLPFRAFTKVYNEWFRDQNVIDPYFYDFDSDTNVTQSYYDRSDLNCMWNGCDCPRASKIKDLFTSALPSPQKGSAVTISNEAIQVPVSTVDSVVFSGNRPPLSFFNTSGNPAGIRMLGISDSSLAGYEIATGASTDFYYPNNLVSNIPSQAIFTINSLRTAFQLQKILEREAFSGSRYCEILKSHYNVTCTDYVLQRAVYLGGKRSPIQIQQVAQTSSTDSTSPQGNLTAFSQTVIRNRDYKMSFSEHGYIVVCGVARQREHYYCQGISKMWRHKNKLDFYLPELANVGLQAIDKSELYAVANDTNYGSTFGYQEAWYEYRYIKPQITGYLRPGIESGLDNWTIGDLYTGTPTLSRDFFEESPDNLDRCLVYDHTVAPQFILDFLCNNIASRELPQFSTPGLIDHH